MKTVVEKLFENAELHPDKLAVVFENEEVTYGELRDAVIKLASWFKLHGVQEGDRILAQANFSKWFIVAYYAAHLCWATIVPLEKRLTQETLQGVIERMQAKAVISWLVPAVEVSLNYANIETELRDVVEQPWKFPSLELMSNIMLTSGTTGNPKGVMKTHKNLAVNILIQIHAFGMKENTVGICMSPLNHVGTQIMWDRSVYNGSTYIFLDGFIKTPKFFEFIEKYNASTFNIPPSGVSIVQSLSQNKLRQYAGQIESVYLQSSAVQKPQLDFLREMLPSSRIFIGYGSSENGLISLQRLDKEIADIRCAGSLMDGVQVNILDESFHDLQARSIGRIAVKSDANCKGYWGMPELNSQVYQNGFFMTNDMGYLDEEGHLYVLGRVDDVINVGGLKLYPSEIENAVLQMDAVKECLCFGVPDEVTGSKIKLLVCLREGKEMHVKDIRSSLAAKLDSYKIPSVIKIVSEIRKNANGKPDRKYYRNHEQ